MRNFLRGWRTFIVNGLIGLVALLDIIVPILGMPEFLAVLPPGWVPYVILLVAIVNVGLRADTRTPPGSRE